MTAGFDDNRVLRYATGAALARVQFAPTISLSATRRVTV